MSKAHVTIRLRVDGEERINVETRTTVAIGSYLVGQAVRAEFASRSAILAVPSPLSTAATEVGFSGATKVSGVRPSFIGAPVGAATLNFDAPSSNTPVRVFVF